ncbi:hypothetical protein J5N97_025959, partial [Dioscorea zingiberensis]
LGYGAKGNKIHYSGPLLRPSGNVDQILKDHDRQIQEVVRQARIDKSKVRKVLAGGSQTLGYGAKGNKIHYSGPLLRPSGNVDQILKDHDRQIQEVVRQARIDKSKVRKVLADGSQTGTKPSDFGIFPLYPSSRGSVPVFTTSRGAA